MSEGAVRVVTASPSDRGTFIGGSDARIIMGSDEAALIRLWQEKRGEAEPEDLSGNLIVQLGAATEELNRSWYERNTGQRVADVQRRVKHSAIPWMAATLDGIVEGTGTVFEAKFMLPWSFSEEAAAEKYMYSTIRFGFELSTDRQHGPRYRLTCSSPVPFLPSSFIQPRAWPLSIS
jgi:YqaJ-like viral recombinase domain